MPGQQGADEISRWCDSTSEINLPYLSYIMFCFLPVQLLKRTCAGRGIGLKNCIQSLQYVYRNSNITVFGAGSIADGLNFDYYISRKELKQNYERGIKFDFEMTSDIDVMFSRPCVNETTPDFILEEGNGELHPGYARLLNSRSKDDNIYVRGTDISEENNDYGYTNNISFYNHGPAQSLKSTGLIAAHGQCVGNFDKVFCLSYPLWPDQAGEWLTRHRPSGWPSQALIDTVKRAGCHFVPVAHPNSSRPDIEWRFSFSQAEVILCQSLTWTQKQCYVLTKLLCKHVIGESDIFCSYYLKTVFFWCCEKISTDHWKPITFASCFLRLLDDLLECLKEGNIPNYFIHTNNMISHISKEKLENISSHIEFLRHNPLRCLLKWNRTYKTIYSFGPLFFIYIFDLDSPPQRRKMLNKQFVERRSISLSVYYMFKLKPVQAIECLTYSELFFQSKRVPSMSERFITLFNHCFKSGGLNSHLVLYMLNAIKYAICHGCNKKENTSAQENHVMKEYVTICSKLDEVTEQSLDEFNFEEMGITGETALLHRSILLYMMCKYKDAYDCSKGILKKAMSGDSAAVNTPTFIYNSVLIGGEFINPYTFRCAGTVSAHALYIMLMAGNKCNILTDEVEIKDVFQFVSNNLYPDTSKYDMGPLAHSYMSVNRYLRAVFLFICRGCEFDDDNSPPSRLMNVLICLVLELLQIAFYVRSHEFQQLAKTVLELLRSPEKTDITEKLDIGNLLLELARIYNYQMLNHVSYSESKEKCYLAYRASLRYHSYADPKTLSEFIVFLCKTRHPHMVYVRNLFRHFLMVRRRSNNACKVLGIPALPKYQFLEESHDTSSSIGFEVILYTCIEMADMAEKYGLSALIDP